MIVLSIDVGIKNLAVTKVIFDGDKSIHDIQPNLIDITKQKKTLTYEQTIENLIDAMNKLNFGDVDIVIIENQPSMKNPKMKTIAVALYMYFKMKDKKVKFVSPSLKLSKEENKKSYKERKKLSIEKTLDLLNDECKKKLEMYKKIDDITDTILMSYVWIRKNKR